MLPPQQSVVSSILLAFTRSLRSLVSLFDRLGFGHVFALLGRAVKMRPFPVVYMRICVNPHQAVATSRCRWISRCLGVSVLCNCTGRGCRTGGRRTLRLE